MANATGSKDSIFQRASKFLKECWIELKKTSWPSSEELKKSTVLVLAAVAVVTVWIGGLDFLFGTVTRRYVGW